MASELERHATPTASAHAELDSLLERYHQRFEGGETIERAEIEAAHPEHAAELWRNVLAWKAVARFLPNATGDEGARAARRPAIRFQSMEGGVPWLDSGLDAEELARRIAERGASIRRYEVVEEIARGAMGAILRVTDLDLGRELAMKVRLVPGADEEEGTPADHSSAAAARFVEEARLTAVLEHPGIPPVHDFGVDDLGNFYFTMPWVRGQTLREVFTAVRSGTSEWSLPRALSLLLQVGDALAYAHAQGVIHRDLKPRNVMVGEFGEAYVMDWGLARDVNRADLVDLHLDVEAGGEGSDSPITTRDGVVIGTPCYMSPEQARGDVEAIGPQTDVYALGAILYELLCGHPPYAPTGSKTPAHRIVNLVRMGPPAAVIEECPGVPAELAAICSRAMAREISQRYADVGELTAELRAFLEGRVVASYAVGPWAELKKWTRRNRGVAALGGVLVVVVLVGAVLLASVERSRREVVERQLDLEAASTLVATARDIGVIGPASLPRMDAWIAEAEDVLTAQDYWEAQLAAFEEDRADEPRVPADTPEVPPYPREMAHLEYRLESHRESVRTLERELEKEPGERQYAWAAAGVETYRRAVPRLLRLIERRRFERARFRATRFVDQSLDRAHLQLWRQVWNLHRLGHPEFGELERVRAERQEAAELERRTLVDPREAWAAAVGAIADERRHPLYAGLELEPRLGLVPLGANPQGLWEFWHPLSGERPRSGPDGEWLIGPETGLVFLLVPGGRYAVGAQDDDPRWFNYVPEEFLLGSRAELHADEDALRAVGLAPYFLSKYEMTQGQWRRLTGGQPSFRYAGTWSGGHAPVDESHPVEHVSWNDCAALGRWGLGLPTEAQWEAAARARIQAPYWWGYRLPSPAGAANLNETVYPSWMEPDGFVHHAPVGSFGSNRWGFHDVTGNVAEWCRDTFADSSYETAVDVETGEFIPAYGTRRAVRGCGYWGNWTEARLSKRQPRLPSFRDEDLGVRPVFVGIE